MKTNHPNSKLIEEQLKQIKNTMVQKNLTSVDLPTYEWNPDELDAECGNGEYLVREKSNEDQSMFWNLYIRRVKLKKGELLFDLQEVYEDTHDNYDELNWYKDQPLTKYNFEEELVENALRSILWTVENS